jgi:apolipoprotein N-acyltransferase
MTERGNLLMLLGFVLSINIGLWGLFSLDDGALSLTFEIIRSSLLGVLTFLPYMIDRWLYPKFRNMGPSATLIFPTVTTAIFFLSSLEGPFDGTVQASKFAYGPTIAQQLLSLLGTWAFIFISSWFASLINYVWENISDWRRSKRTAIIFIAIVVATLSFGAIKIAATRPEQSTVKIAAVIMEFPHYMRQAGRAGVDIMLSPSYEWPKGLVIHSVYMRAIENGFSLVLPTFDGITIIEDVNGRFLSQMDSAEAGDGILYAEVPTQGINTVYTTLGDLFGWLCVLGTAAIVVLSIISRVSKRSERSRTAVFG